MTTTLPAPPAPSPERAPLARSRISRHGPPAGLLAVTAVLYLWGLSASGWANAFYAAAAQAGGTSWTAWFFGSSDAANSITVDKTPAALWIMGLSVRLFGLSSWSILVPQALMGVAAVGLLYASVRRTAGTAAGLLAGAVLALTPVAVLMFRFDNPDALLTLVLVGSAYATLRAVERGGTRWLLLAGTLVGFGFLAKMLQAFLVLPALALVWLLVAPVGIGRRLRDLALATGALIVSAGWWVLVVELWPATARPYIGGSQTNSVLELVFGYNGFGRLTGDEVGSVGGGGVGVGAGGVGAGGVGGGGGVGGATGSWGETGLLRLFDDEFGGQASWLLPAALALLVALLWWTRRAPRTDPLRAATLLWGGWLVVTAVVFSLMAGIFHPYYLVALAPAIAGLVGIGAVVLWRDRARPAARWVAAGTVVGTAVWAFVLLRRTPDWQPWLAWTVLLLGAVAAAGLLALERLDGTTQADRDAIADPADPPTARAHPATAQPDDPGRRRRWVRGAVVAAVVAAGLAGPTGYSIATAATPHTGAIPTAGPAGAGMRAFGGGGVRGGSAGGTADGFAGRTAGGTAGGFGGGTAGGIAGRAAGGTAGGFAGGTADGTAGGFAGGTPPAFGGQTPGARLGGLLGSPTPSAALVAALTTGPDTEWLAAAVGSNTAAGYQLATQRPVMAVGGFNGTDPSPTLAAFQQLVAQGRVHWFIGGGTGTGGGGGAGIMGSTASGGSGEARLVADWVAATYPSMTVDGTVLYDLTWAVRG